MKENIGVSGTWLFTWRDKDGNILETREEHNLITQSGLEAIAALFIGDPEQCYIPCPGHRKQRRPVGTKNWRRGVPKSSYLKTRDLNEVRLRFFLTTSEANGEWSEMGVFLAGTEGKDSGWNLNHILPSGGIRKASNQTLTVEVRIRFQGVS